MSSREGLHFSTVRGLGLLVLAAVLFAGSGWIWNLGASRIALNQRNYPLPASHCEQAKTCNQKALIDGRVATTADTALYISLGQLVASILGLGGVGYTVFYARLAWREAERSANAAHDALDDTRRETAEQAARFDAQLKVAAESAQAMGRVADAMTRSADNVEKNMDLLHTRSAQQMRAYVTVLTGNGNAQKRPENIRFEGIPVFLNTGATPAHNLRYRADSAIMDLLGNPDFDFPLSGEWKGGATLNSQQSFTISVLYPHFIPDQDVPDVRLGIGRAMVAWGEVAYEDIFGETHTTRFGIIYRYFAGKEGDQISGHYTRNHNTSD